MLIVLPMEHMILQGLPMHTCLCLLALAAPNYMSLGAHSGRRRGTELVYPLFNVLLTDKFPSQEKVRCASPGASG